MLQIIRDLTTQVQYTERHLAALKSAREALVSVAGTQDEIPAPQAVQPRAPRMSAAGRKAISDAAKRRWVAHNAAKTAAAVGLNVPRRRGRLRTAAANG